MDREPISTIEDLDPDPPSPKGGRQLAELALGLALLLAVLGFAGWQWFHQENQQREYAAGTEALLQRNLDEAHAHFAAASGYRDADAQAQAAAQKLSDRDSQYRDALDYQDSGAWAACLKAIQQVSLIQPDYRNSAQIEQKAKDEVYRQVMSGTIALRANASPPGLYYYGNNGWAWLTGSDRYSKVWGASYSSDYVVYDMADGSADPKPEPTPQSGGPNPPNMASRHFMSVQVSNQYLTHPSNWTYNMPDKFLVMDPAYDINLDPDKYYPLLYGKDGIWAEDVGANDTGTILPIRNSYSGYHGTIAYQSYGSPITHTVQLPYRTNAAVMTLDHNGPRYLLARWEDGLSGTPSNTPNAATITSLYIIDLTRSQRRLLYTMKGGSFISAEFSPDGKHALLSTYTPYGVASQEQQEVLLLDLQGKVAPRKLGEIIARVNTNLPINTLYQSSMTAAFIESGPYNNKVALAEFDGDHYHIRVFNVEQEGEPLVDVEVPTRIKIAWSVFQGNDDITLLVGIEQPTSSELPARPLRFVALPLSKSPTVTKLSVEKNSSIEATALIGDRLVFSTYEYSTNNRNTRSVYSFPIRRFGIEGERPWTMYKQTGSADSPDMFSDGSHSFGSDIFAYISGGDLHARLYDGSVDVVLEHNVTYLYSTTTWFPERGALR